jgi:hypothetical protein
VTVLNEKDRVEELLGEWKSLWNERVDDHVRAEAIAKRDYSDLFVERGTVIFATRKFRLLSFREILELQGISDPNRFIPVDPRVGGWGKFIRKSITAQKSTFRVKRTAYYFEETKRKQQLKKGGRGWVHF